MPRTYEISMLPQYEPPYYPVVRVSGSSRRLLNPFLYFLDCFPHISLFIKSKRPVTITRGVGVFGSAMKLRLSTNIYGLRVKLMQVEQKCQVAISVGVALRIETDALPPMVHRLVIEL